jgi:hypothetical protein
MAGASLGRVGDEIGSVMAGRRRVEGIRSGGVHAAGKHCMDD